MLMFTSSVVADLRQELKEARRELDGKIRYQVEKELEIKNLKREYELQKQEAVAELRKEMSKSLIDSDLLRNEAIAKLAIYEKLDTKADANVIKDMLGRLIDSMGKKQDINIIK